MIQITQLKLPADHKPEALKKKAAKALRLDPKEIRTLRILRHLYGGSRGQPGGAGRPT